MTVNNSAIRVSSLASVLDGQDPKDLIHSLLEAGYDRFYVQVPQGFVVSIWPFDPCPPGHQLIWTPPQFNNVKRARERKQQICFLQLSRAQLKDIAEHPPIAVHAFAGGYLQSASRSDELFPVDFEYRPGLPGVLLPKDCTIADSLATDYKGRLAGPVVIKKVNDTKSYHSYVLHGLTVDDVFIEASAPLMGSAVELESERENASVAEIALCDPYGLSESSPLVYEILIKAFENRGKAKNELSSVLLAAEFKRLNDKYGNINPKPFNDKREKLAACLAKPGYKYKKKSARLTPPVPRAPVIPQDDFLDQGFVNETFKKVLYAACCWADRMDPPLGKDLVSLVDLLRGLGFRDAGRNDPVQQILYFIVGDLVDRCGPDMEYRDFED